MPVEFYKRGPSITERDIRAFEARIGCTLPVDYRAFLLKFNGGRPEFHVIRNSERGDLGVNIFYGLWDNEHYDIDAQQQAMRGRWPDRFLSIASDDGGNCFLLSLGAPDFGNIYYWDHEEEAEEDEEPTELNLYHVAESFAEFWERIEPIDRDAYLAEKDRELESRGRQRHGDASAEPETNGDSV